MSQQYTSLQVSLAVEAFNTHAVSCYRCTDVASTYARGEAPCAQGDFLSKPIRAIFKEQDAIMQRDFPGQLHDDIIVKAAFNEGTGASYQLLAFLNQRRRQKLRQTPSPVMQYSVPVPVPAYHQPPYGYGASLEVNHGSRTTRYGTGHSRSGSDTTNSIPSNSPQSQFYHPNHGYQVPPSSFPPRQYSGTHLAPSGRTYQTHHSTGRSRAPRQVRFEEDSR